MFHPLCCEYDGEISNIIIFGTHIAIIIPKGHKISPVIFIHTHEMK